jgi:hypothetical protein
LGIGDPLDAARDVLWRVFLTIALTIETRALASSTSDRTSSEGPILQRPQIRRRRCASRTSFSEMLHFDTKSRQLSAARASSSMAAIEVEQLTS